MRERDITKQKIKYIKTTISVEKRKGRGLGKVWRADSMIKIAID